MKRSPLKIGSLKVSDHCFEVQRLMKYTPREVPGNSASPSSRPRSQKKAALASHELLQAVPAVRSPVPCLLLAWSERVGWRTLEAAFSRPWHVAEVPWQARTRRSKRLGARYEEQASTRSGPIEYTLCRLTPWLILNQGTTRSREVWVTDASDVLSLSKAFFSAFRRRPFTNG